MPPTDVKLTLPPCFAQRRALMLNFNREPMDSDADSDSEWYHNEFSKRIETPSLSPLLQPSRPDSIFIPADVFSPATKRRSMTSDMVYPRKRNSRSRSIILPSYRPLPPLPQHPPQRTLVNLSRPPPRSTLPADCVIDLFVDGGNEADADSDSSSTFSFKMYEIDLRAHPKGKQTQSIPQSPVKSRLSLDLNLGQEIDLDLDQTRFDLDYQLPLPFSPLDLEFDISKRLESVGEKGSHSKEIRPTPTSVKRTTLTARSVYPQDHLSTPIGSPFSFPPSPSPPPPSLCEQTNGFHREDKILKSKWSTSTLGSVLDDQTRNKNKQLMGKSASKLKLYFGGGNTASPKSSSKHSKHPSSSSKSFSPPSSPSSSTPPRKTKTYSPSLSPSPLPLRWPNSRGHKSKPSISQLPPPQRPSTPTTYQPAKPSEVLIIGYGQDGGLKRRGSMSSMTSDTSTSSSSSHGMKRKPIPIEMFLRNVA